MGKGSFKVGFLQLSGLNSCQPGLPGPLQPGLHPSSAASSSDNPTPVFANMKSFPNLLAISNVEPLYTQNHWWTYWDPQCWSHRPLLASQPLHILAGGPQPNSLTPSKPWFPQMKNESWRRKWQPTPVFLLGESHAQRRLAVHKSWTQLSDWTAAATRIRVIWPTIGFLW